MGQEAVRGGGVHPAGWALPTPVSGNALRGGLVAQHRGDVDPSPEPGGLGRAAMTSFEAWWRLRRLRAEVARSPPTRPGPREVRHLPSHLAVRAQLALWSAWPWRKSSLRWPQNLEGATRCCLPPEPPPQGRQTPLLRPALEGWAAGRGPGGHALGGWSVSGACLPGAGPGAGPTGVQSCRAGARSLGKSRREPPRVTEAEAGVVTTERRVPVPDGVGCRGSSFTFGGRPRTPWTAAPALGRPRAEPLAVWDWSAGHTPPSPPSGPASTRSPTRRAGGTVQNPRPQASADRAWSVTEAPAQTERALLSPVEGGSVAPAVVSSVRSSPEGTSLLFLEKGRKRERSSNWVAFLDLPLTGHQTHNPRGLGRAPHTHRPPRGSLGGGWWAGAPRFPGASGTRRSSGGSGFRGSVPSSVFWAQSTPLTASGRAGQAPRLPWVAASSTLLGGRGRWTPGTGAAAGWGEGPWEDGQAPVPSSPGVEPERQEPLHHLPVHAAAALGGPPRAALLPLLAHLREHRGPGAGRAGAAGLPPAQRLALRPGLPRAAGPGRPAARGPGPGAGSEQGRQRGVRARRRQGLRRSPQRHGLPR